MTDDALIRLNKSRAREQGRGRHARHPWAIPLRGWRDVSWRVGKGIIRDRISANAAGAAFFIILALVPAVAALVSLYPLVGDPTVLRGRLDDLYGYLPQTMIEIIDRELARLTQQPADVLSITFATTVFFAFYIVNSAVQGLFDALNVIYGEKEKRSLVRLYASSLAFTLCALVFIMLVLNVIIGVPILISLLPLGRAGEILLAALPALALYIIANIGIAALFRFGPSRRPARWRWISVGSVAASSVCLAASAAFSYYLSHWANYSVTYGSLGTIAGIMMWAYITIFIILVGAEIDAELERQTAQDTTVPPEKPMGMRGAVVADDVGPARPGSLRRMEGG